MTAIKFATYDPLSSIPLRGSHDVAVVDFHNYRRFGMARGARDVPSAIPPARRTHAPLRTAAYIEGRGSPTTHTDTASTNQDSIAVLLLYYRSAKSVEKNASFIAVGRYCQSCLLATGVDLQRRRHAMASTCRSTS